MNTTLFIRATRLEFESFPTEDRYPSGAPVFTKRVVGINDCIFRLDHVLFMVERSKPEPHIHVELDTAIEGSKTLILKGTLADFESRIFTVALR